MGRKRTPQWEQQLGQMTSQQRGCRNKRHWWDPEIQMEWVHKESYPNGSIKIGIQRLPCTRPCGAVNLIRVKFTRGGHREIIGSRIDYSGCKDTYLFKLPAGETRPTPGQIRQACLERVPVPAGFVLP